MPVFQSMLNTSSETYQQNRTDMLGLVDKMRELESRAAVASSRELPRFEKRAQLLPRERLKRLLDPGAPFIEIGNMGGYLSDIDDPDKTVVGGSQLTGIGIVSGVRCMVVVNDSGIGAGALIRPGGEKIVRCQELALANKMPFVQLVESAGADMAGYTIENFVRGGNLFRNLARLSAAGCPVITVLHGASTAGGAYMSGLSDYVVAVRGRGRAFLAGPPLLKAATGEIATDEELGGAKMHATTSGLVEYLAEDDADGIRMAREVVEHLGWNDHALLPQRSKSVLEPKYDPDEIAGLVSLDYRKPYDVRELIARLVDGSYMMDFKPRYGVTTVCMHGEIYGQSCAFIGNNGPIDNAGATKAAQFIQLNCQSNTPIVYLQNTTGFMVGKEHEAGGMIKHGAKMIQAVSNASVPQVTLMVGASFGAGNFGMCGVGFDPDLSFAWPNAQIGLMGAEQAAMTMRIVAERSAERRGKTVDENALKEMEEGLIKHFDYQSNAFYYAGQNLSDGMIDPRDTRKVLHGLFDMFRERQHRKMFTNSFGVARL